MWKTNILEGQTVQGYNGSCSQWSWAITGLHCTLLRIYMGKSLTSLEMMPHINGKRFNYTYILLCYIKVKRQVVFQGWLETAIDYVVGRILHWLLIFPSPWYTHISVI